MPDPPADSDGPHHDLEFSRPTEHGASFISGEHSIMRKLAYNYELPLAVVNGVMRTLNGGVYTDPDSFQLAWDDASSYEDGPVVLLGFLGGDKGASIGTQDRAFGAASDTEVSGFLNAVEFVFPGTRDAYTGKAMASNWSRNKWSGGAYVSYGLGGYTG